MNSELKSGFISGAIFRTANSQNRQDLLHQIVRCLEGKGAWPEGKEIFYGEETKWDDLSLNSPQTRGEFSILSSNCGALFSALEGNDWIVEFGVGTGIDTKAGRILEIAKNSRCYIGVDRNERFVHQHIARLRKKFPCVTCVGFVGEFDDAYNLLVEISGHFKYRNGCLLSLGSTLSNSSPEKLIETLRHWSRIFPNMMIGQDSNTDAMSVGKAYNDNAFRQFIWAGIKHVNKLLPEPLFAKGFELKGCVRQGPPFMVQLAITARDGVSEYFKGGRQVIIFTAYKYRQEEFIALVKEANETASITTFSHPSTESRIYSITFPHQGPMDP